MDEKLDLTTLRRTALRRASVCTALYALSIASAAVSHTAFEMLICPGALAGTAAAWYWLKGLALCRREKYLRRYFSRILRAALVLPVFAALSLAPLQIESIVAPAAGRMASLLWVIPFLLASPVLVAVLTSVALHASVQHMRLTSESDGRLYRELPFALMMLTAIGLILGAAAYVYMLV